MCLRDTPVSASPMLELQACNPMLGLFCGAEDRAQVFFLVRQVLRSSCMLISARHMVSTEP